MQILEVGKQYPKPCPNPGQDFALINVLSNGSFDLLMYMNKPSFDEKIAAKEGSFTYCCFRSEHVPFFCVEFDKFSFDASLNVYKINTRDRINWLNTEANLVNLIMIDSSTNTIKSLRAIGIESPVMFEIKHMCRKQLSFYSNAAEVDKKITAITKVYSTDDMLMHADRYKIEG